MDLYSGGKEDRRDERGAIMVGRVANWMIFPIAVGAVVNAAALFALTFALGDHRAGYWATVLAVASAAISAIAKFVEERSR